jgi:hypothetical protein
VEFSNRFFSLFVSKVEAEHPELFIKIRSKVLTRKAVQLRDAAAAIIRRRDELEDRFESKTKDKKKLKLNSSCGNTRGRQIGTLLLEKKSS